MVKYLPHIVLGLLVIIATSIIHLSISYIVPFPYNKANFIFAVLIMLLLLRRTGMVVWLAFALHFLLELYAVTPFGVQLFSGTVTMLLLYWIAEKFFTNASSLVVAAMSIVAIVLYRLLYALVLTGAGIIVEGASQTISWSTFIIVGWEMLWTMILSLLFYVVLHRLFHKDKQHILQL